MDIVHEMGHLLDTNNVNYWLDDGTLLGVIRDNALIESDHDIDISIDYRSLPEFKKAVAEAESKGYQSKCTQYRGLTTHISLKSESYNRPINFKVHYEYDNCFLCPAFSAYRTDNISNSVTRYSLRALQFALFKYWRVASLITTDRRSVLSIPVNQVCEFKTWKIPSGYVSKLDKSNQGFSIPHNVDSYLTYRYGDWQTPTDDWNYWIDDNGLSDTPLEDIVTDSFFAKYSQQI